MCSAFPSFILNHSLLYNSNQIPHRACAKNYCCLFACAPLTCALSWAFSFASADARSCWCGHNMQVCPDIHSIKHSPHSVYFAIEQRRRVSILQWNYCIFYSLDIHLCCVHCLDKCKSFLFPLYIFLKLLLSVTFHFAKIRINSSSLERRWDTHHDCFGNLLIFCPFHSEWVCSSNAYFAFDSSTVIGCTRI